MLALVALALIALVALALLIALGFAMHGCMRGFRAAVVGLVCVSCMQLLWDERGMRVAAATKAGITEAGVCGLI